jgi:hypothetical protein
MPRKRQYASRAEQQAAYRRRCAEKVANVTPIQVEVDDEVRDRWDTAVHEAAHAVMQLRFNAGRINKYGGVESIEVFDFPKGDRDGECRYRGFVAQLATVAGNFAAMRWGTSRRRGSYFGDGSCGDYLNILRDIRDHRFYVVEWTARTSMKRRAIKKVDRLEANKVWNRTMRQLSALVRRDPSFERQVKIVAAELCKKRIMTGDEVAALIGVTNPTEEQILGKEA